LIEATHKRKFKVIQDVSQQRQIGLKLYVPLQSVLSAAEFYQEVFLATPLRKFSTKVDDVVTAIDLRLNDSIISICGASPKRDVNPSVPGPCSIARAGRVSVLFEIYVADVDVVFLKALQEGSDVRSYPEDSLSGDRVATIIDPFGYIWALLAPQALLSIDEFNSLERSPSFITANAGAWR
jgi:uncharacterized glyoxalase superfamily protein PhnB